MKKYLAFPEGMERRLNSLSDARREYIATEAALINQIASSSYLNEAWLFCHGQTDNMIKCTYHQQDIPVSLLTSIPHDPLDIHVHYNDEPIGAIKESIVDSHHGNFLQKFINVYRQYRIAKLRSCIPGLILAGLVLAFLGANTLFGLLDNVFQDTSKANLVAWTLLVSIGACSILPALGSYFQKKYIDKVIFALQDYRLLKHLHYLSRIAKIQGDKEKTRLTVARMANQAHHMNAVTGDKLLTIKQILAGLEEMEARVRDSLVEKGMQRPNHHVVLIGMPGSGKTTLGMRLAEILDIPFVDTDRIIEIRSGMSVATFMETHGEMKFRDLEYQILEESLEDYPRVISTGGGAFLNPWIRAKILKRAFSIWLKTDLDILVERCSQSDQRPLLDWQDDRDLREQLKKLMDERHSFYSQAETTIDTSQGTEGEILEKILEALNLLVTTESNSHL